MIAYHGENVWPDRGAPTVRSIGIQLGRIPRFCGSTREWYPVLSHVIVVAQLLPAHLRIHGLLHDAPEAILGDVPSTWKTEAARYQESEILDRIYDELGQTHIGFDDASILKQADLCALAAEAHVLGHPAAAEHWPDPDMNAMRLTEKRLALGSSTIDPKISGPLYVECVDTALMFARVPQ
jgi:hypothetical protein